MSKLDNPYTVKSDRAFWAKSVRATEAVDLFTSPAPEFSIRPTDRIAVAGSCFAQYLARGFAQSNKYILNLEPDGTDSPYSSEESQLFSARYGNIYSSRQLLQLFQRAHGFSEPAENVWKLKSGRFVDPFRPRIPAAGFSTGSEVLVHMTRHLDAVQKMFRECSIFVFTIGLTEIWESVIDGTVVPSPPGVIKAASLACDYRFHNLNVQEVQQDLATFLELFRGVNPSARVILTVSPVPLAATFTDDHIFCANTRSKAVLRLAVDEIVRTNDFVDYFPSYEYVTSPHRTRTAFLANQRTVRPEVVQQVLNGFTTRYLKDNEAEAPVRHESVPSHLEYSVSSIPERTREISSIEQPPCDEELFGGAHES